MTDSVRSSSAPEPASSADPRRRMGARWRSEGVAALNVREVARSVGLRQQSLTYYFPTKQDLLDAPVRRRVRRPAAKRSSSSVRPTTPVEASSTSPSPSSTTAWPTPPAITSCSRDDPRIPAQRRQPRRCLAVLGVLVGRLAAAGVNDDRRHRPRPQRDERSRGGADRQRSARSHSSPTRPNERSATS